MFFTIKKRSLRCRPGDKRGNLHPHLSSSSHAIFDELPFVTVAFIVYLNVRYLILSVTLGKADKKDRPACLESVPNVPKGL